jgi:hypothetical protein
VKVCDSLHLLSWVPVDGSSPFTRSREVMDNMGLSVKTDLPPGDHIFFPFANPELVSRAQSLAVSDQLVGSCLVGDAG